MIHLPMDPATYEAELAAETVNQLSLLPTEEQIAIRRYIGGIPGHIARLAAVIAICLTILTMTQSATLGLFCVVIAVGATTALRSNCWLLRLLVGCAGNPARHRAGKAAHHRNDRNFPSEFPMNIPENSDCDEITRRTPQCA